VQVQGTTFTVRPTVIGGLSPAATNLPTVPKPARAAPPPESGPRIAQASV